MDGPGAHARVGAPGPALPRRAAPAAVRGRRRHRRRAPASRRATPTGSPHAVSDWTELLERDDVDVVSVCGPNFVHREIGDGGGRVRPPPVDREAGRAQCRGHRRHRGRRARGRRDVGGRVQLPHAPAVQVARELVAAGRLGRLESVDVHMLADYSAHPDRRSRGASTRSTPAPACSATWPATVSTSPSTSAVTTLGGVAELVADQATYITERPARPTGGRLALRPRWRRSARAGRQRGHRLGAAALRLRRPRHPGRLAGGGGGAVHLRLRRPRHRGRSGVGLPADGRAAAVPRPGLPGRGLGDPLRPGRRRRPRGLPARARAWPWASTTSRSSSAACWSRASTPASRTARPSTTPCRGGRAGRRDGAVLRREDDGCQP